MKYRHILGTVKSRRLGRSLGVNLIPGKICSLDCIYCEAGRTQILTAERQVYFPAEEVTEELRCYLKENPNVDFITYSGMGEPTLHSKLGEISRYIKEEFGQYKLALITNGTLFYRDDVRRDAMFADLVMPSLDAVSNLVFNKVNKPESSLNNEKIIDGLCEFKREYKGQMWLEFFVVPGINDSVSELKLMKEAIVKINPDRLQLNSLDRPSPGNNVVIADRNYLEKLKDYFSDTGILTEVISRIPQKNGVVEEEILKLLGNKDVAIEEIKNKFNACEDIISGLTLAGKIEMTEKDGVSFYRLK